MIVTKKSSLSNVLAHPAGTQGIIGQKPAADTAVAVAVGLLPRRKTMLPAAQLST
jgi:hypothetical protein